MSQSFPGTRVPCLKPNYMWIYPHVHTHTPPFLEFKLCRVSLQVWVVKQKKKKKGDLGFSFFLVLSFIFLYPLRKKKIHKHDTFLAVNIWATLLNLQRLHRNKGDHVLVTETCNTCLGFKILEHILVSRYQYCVIRLLLTLAFSLTCYWKTNL